MTDETRIVTGPYFRLPPGTQLNGIYEIDQFITAGGMGEIYRGRAIETGDTIAIKTVRPDLAQNTAALALFRREALALHNLYHEAIVRYFLFSVDPALALPYLAMEYVEGESLSEIIGRGALAVPELRTLLHRLAQGLQAAHRLGIIHRDLSPDNILVPGGDVARAKIIDFGIARSPLGEGTVIGSGFAGKMNYVSPEQLGLYGGDVGPPSDIYSLGLVVAEAARGQRLDMGHSHVEVIDRRRRVPDLTGIDPGLRPLLQRMLQPNPKDRPQGMVEVEALIPAERPPRRRGPWIAATMASLVVLAGLGVGGLQYGGLIDLGAFRPSADEAPAPVPQEPSRPEPARPEQAERPPAPPDTAEAPAEPERDEPSPASRPPERPPEAPEPPPAPSRRPAASAEQIREFLRTYAGGQCFYIAPVTIAASEAVIEAYGTTPAPFMAFDEAFQRKLGFEPEINLRQITLQQCPVADYLTRQGTSRNSGRKPSLALKTDLLRSGGELVATTSAKTDRYVEIFLVADDGAVYSLANSAKRNGDTIAISLKLVSTGTGEDAKPQLLVALASAKPLSGLLAATKAGPINAERFIRQLTEDGNGGSPFTIGVKYFKLSNPT